MLKVLSELFCPPYDVVQLLLILLLLLFVIYTCFVISLLFRRFYADHKTSRFFSQHKVTSGAVIKYEVSDGNIYTTASQAVPGVSSIFVPRIHQTPSQFSIVLECHDGGTPFHARYEIPSEDFKAHKEGENIQIQEYWEPIEYQAL